ncbi:MAG: hypothetical protein IPH78_09295 [Bacteroidetes bacterium]|nr:hypothetical protein [Bacteroidota bacterium]MBK8659123.1 hypothetical protein [Bacteroidota bacterium]
MKSSISIFLLLLLLNSCNERSSASQPETQQEDFVAQMSNGKYNTDFETAQELKGMRNTIENFTLLNKKKFENLKAYQEFGNLMEMHVDRVNQYCRLDASSKNILCKKLDKIKTEVQTLQGEDMVKSKEALMHINTILADIDSSFSYMNQ